MYLLRVLFVSTLFVVGSMTESVEAHETSVMKTSWYGPGMQCYWIEGQCKHLMANGEEFDMDDPTVVAHKELPFGTELEIINPENGRTAVVSVQDRGPFTPGRELDVSRGVAAKLDIIKEGVVNLVVTQLD